MTANPRRDASSAIRGFYYQIQLTVQRWIELKPEDELYCERGEDIEVISGALSGGPTMEQLLEQVKVRSAISLRSPESVSAVARFFESVTLGARPALFRFITTARAARERGVSFPRDLPGLVAWNAARNRELDNAEIARVGHLARQMLAEAARPSDINRKLASAFNTRLKGLSDEDFIREFVERIEWALAADGLDSLRQDLTASLVASSRAATEPEALRLVDLLVAHVFRLLTQPGIKRLVAADLDQVLDQAALSNDDRRVLALLEAFSAQTAAQLSALESKTDAILGSVGTNLQGALARLLSKGGLSVPDIASVPRIADGPPGLQEWIAVRPNLTTQVGQILTQQHVQVLLGPTGMGKTTLAALVFQYWPSPRRHWISLTQRVRADAREHMLEQLAIQGGLNYETAIPFRRLAQEYSGVLADGLLVLDNVPDTNADTLLTDQLSDLADSIVRGGGHVLITTHTPAPASMLARLQGLSQFVVPQLTVDEVGEIMRLAGVHGSLLSSRIVELIHATTSGHPILVAATVRYIRSRPNFDQSALMAVLVGDSVRPVRTETRRRLRELLPQDARELLDRLSTVGNEFDKDMGFALAAVDPPIRNAGELIEDLRGVWLHSLPKGRFELSPLLTGVGREVLDPGLQQRVHQAIARVYLTARSIGPGRAIGIAVHLIAARQWQLLNGFLIQVSFSIRSPQEAKSFDILPAMFRPSFPDHLAIPLGSRIVLRAAQARVAFLTGGKTQVFLSDLRALTDSISQDALIEAFIGWLLVGPFNPAAPVAMCGEAVVRASRLAARLPSFLIAELPTHLESLIWASLPNLRSSEDVDAFVGSIVEMTDLELGHAFAEERLSAGIEIAAGKCWTVELEHPEGERDWSRPIGRLDRLIEKGRSARVGALVDAAERAKAGVLSDFANQPEIAVQILSYDLQNREPAERMRREHLAAGVLLDHVSPEAALERYDVALEGPARADPQTFGDAARRAAEAAAKLRDWRRAIRYATRAVAPLRGAGLEYESLDIITELAWLHWEAGNHVRAAAAMAGVVKRIVVKPEIESARYRETFRKAGLLLGWMSSLGLGRDKPWGGAPFATPFPGWSSRSRPGLSTAPNPISPPFISYLLARVTADAGFRRSALALFRHAALIAKNHGASVVECLARSGEAEVGAAERDVEHAVPAALFGTRMFVLAKTSEESEILSSVSVSDVWAAAPRDKRRTIQAMLFWEVIAPALTNGVAEHLNDEAFLGLIARLRATLLVHAEDVEDLERWGRLLDLAESAFGGKMTAFEIRQAIAGADAKDTTELIVLYLGQMRSPDASLDEVCGAQIVCMTTFKAYQTWLSPALVDLAAFVVDFWRGAARERGYAMSGPMLFRKIIQEVQAPTVQNAARILLSAQVATGIRISGGLRASLSELAET